MNNHVRTSIILPENLLRDAKQTALDNKTTVSELVRTGLKKVVYSYPKEKFRKYNLKKFIGGRSLGIKSFKREEIYDEYLRKKMSTGY